MIFEEDELDSRSLAHYGIQRKSGRYPWGSGGDTAAARSKDFFAYVQQMRSAGLTDAQIAQGLSTPDHPFTTTHLRATNTMALAASKAADISRAQTLRDAGYSNVQIGKKFSPPKNESSIRALLDGQAQAKIDILNSTSSMLRSQVDEKGVVDVGSGVHQQLGISKEKLRTAIAMLEAEGYVNMNVQIDQQGTMNKTTTSVLAKPGTTYKDVVTNKGSIKSLQSVSEDGGRSFYGILPPLPVSSKRVEINYAEDGGGKADGVMYIRPGVKDLDMGHANYAQVRINVDGTHYLKGMAVYKNDLPEGTDILFNTNKKRSDLGPSKLAALKKQSDDPDNPFGAVIHQLGEHNKDGHLTKVTSAVNIVNDEGKWDTWSRTLSSQTLSKQSPVLAEKQLAMSFERKKNEFDSIMALTNPVVKQHLLEKFSDSADASAVHLKAAALPRSSWHVLLPVNSLKEHEIYAPNFNNGDQVALIRYPHGGKFEIPELTVNNRNKEAISIMGKTPKDAVGIHSKVAERLSGADFDGDAVLVIPNNSRTIRTMPPLQGLKNFDPQTRYAGYDGMKTIDGGTYSAKAKEATFPPGKKSNPRGKGTEMGKISNLITDMTIQGASTAELAAAVRHSMVVIDAEKHHLNFRQSAKDNNINHLKAKYQMKATGGASTLISRATAPINVVDRAPRPHALGGPVDKATGKKMFGDPRKSWVDPKTGETKFKTRRSERLAETDNAHTLVSKDGGTKIEHVYADHSNRLKALANQARKESVVIKNPLVSDSAKKAYAPEVKSLTAKLNEALKNSPRERQAQVLAGVQVQMKKDATPDMDPAHLKRIKSQALDEARRRTGAKKKLVTFEGREWEAVQAGAIPASKLKSILANTDIEKVKTLATPKAKLSMSSTKISRARQMLDHGYTQAEIASQLGVSVTTLKEGLKANG